jgi:hypothetical protein
MLLGAACRVVAVAGCSWPSVASTPSAHVAVAVDAGVCEHQAALCQSLCGAARPHARTSLHSTPGAKSPKKQHVSLRCASWLMLWCRCAPYPVSPRLSRCVWLSSSRAQHERGRGEVCCVCVVCVLCVLCSTRHCVSSYPHPYPHPTPPCVHRHAMRDLNTLASASHPAPYVCKTGVWWRCRRWAWRRPCRCVLFWRGRITCLNYRMCCWRECVRTAPRAAGVVCSAAAVPACARMSLARSNLLLLLAERLLLASFARSAQ